VAIVAGVKWLARSLGLVLAVALTAPPLIAHAEQAPADRQAEIRNEIERLREELDEVAAEEAGVLAELRVTQRRRAEEQAKLAEIDAKASAAMAALTAAQAELDAASALERRIQGELDQVTGQLEEARALLKAQAVAAFIRFGSSAERLDVLLRATDVSELHDAKAFVDALAERQARIVDTFSALQDDTTALRAEAEAARQAATARHDEVRAQTEALEAARLEQISATAAVTAEVNREQSLLESLRGSRAQYERRIAEMRRESDAIAELLRRRGSGGVALSGNGSLSSPLANPVVSSTFGYRVHPIFGDRRLHTGLDFSASTGTPISASAPGEVVFAGWRGGYGNCTIIDHGGGVATLYAHQSVLRVTEGAVVSRGQVIGAVGATGYATGPHLHFEVRRDGTPVDPLPYL